MQFLYVGYYDAERMDALSKEEIDALMSRCDALMNTFNKQVDVLSDWHPGLTTQAFYWQDGVVQKKVEPDRTHGEQIGSLIVFEARDLDHAMELASFIRRLKSQKGNLTVGAQKSVHYQVPLDVWIMDDIYDSSRTTRPRHRPVT